MVPVGGLKEIRVPEVLLRVKGGPKVLWREKGVEMKSYAGAVKLSPGRVGESVCLEVGEREVRGRLEQMRQCLVGWWGINSTPLPELEYVRSWTYQYWALKGNLGVVVLGRGHLLFDFESPSEAERVLARGKRTIKENFIILDRWNPEVGCLCKDSIVDEAWVRVVRLLLHLWSHEVFKRIGDGCGGFVAVDEDTISLSELQWAWIMKRAERDLPNFAHVVMGSGCYSLHLWWESPPWFKQVVLAGRICGEDSPRVGEEDGGTSRAVCCGSQREKVEQLSLQLGVQDVSSVGGNPPTLPVEVSGKGLM